MEIFKLEARGRETIGGPNARRMRASGFVPAMIYGHGENVMCAVEERLLRDLLITPKVYLIELSVDGKVETVILKDVQYHPVSDRPLHLDFYRYVEDEPLTIAIPVVLQGHALGVKAGGKLMSGIRKLRVRGLPKDLPDFLPVNIDKLRLGEVLLVGSIHFENLEIIDTKTLVVAAIKTQRGASAVAMDEEEEASDAAETPAEE